MMPRRTSGSPPVSRSLRHAFGDEGAAQPVEFLKAQQVGLRQEGHVLGHAIDAAEIAAVGHRHPQIGDGARKRIDQRARAGCRRGRFRIASCVGRMPSFRPCAADSAVRSTLDIGIVADNGHSVQRASALARSCPAARISRCEWRCKTLLAWRRRRPGRGRLLPAPASSAAGAAGRLCGCRLAARPAWLRASSCGAGFLDRLGGGGAGVSSTTTGFGRKCVGVVAG